MRWEITEDSAFPVLKFSLEAGEEVKAQSGVMMAMSNGLQLTGKADGGIGRALGRMFSGESFFLQNIKAQDKAGWVLFAAEMPGEIAHIEVGQISNDKYVLKPRCVTGSFAKPFQGLAFKTSTVDRKPTELLKMLGF